MKITYEEMRDTASRLPVGYYLGRKVPVMVEPSGGAYCDTVKCEIHVGMDILAQAASHITAADAAKWDREKLLRCVLYHEVGHVLLTPNWLGGLSVHKPDGSGYFPAKTAHAIVNIFEDERLERVLSSFFIGVDFSGFVRLVNGDFDAKTDVQKILAAVRMRKTTPEISSAVDDAIQDLAAINATTDTCVRIGSEYVEVAYQSELDKLVKLILESVNKPQEEDGDGDAGQQQQQQQQQSGGEQQPDAEQEKPQGESSGESESGGDSGEDDEGDKSEEKSEDADKSSTSGEDDADGEDEDKRNDEGDEDEDKDEGDGEDEDEAKDDEHGDGDADDADEEPEPADESSESEPPEGCQKPRPVAMSSGALKAVADQLFSTPTPEVAKTLARFAQRISKKKGTQAAGRWSALHGKIDTRRDAMDKERIFRRSSDVGERLMSAVNLTMWIDTSGSFCRSKDEINRILAATAQAMKMSGGKLAVNVVKMVDRARVAASHDWAVLPWGTNDINETYETAWEQTRRKDRRNIDIVVFDGANSCAALWLQGGMPEDEIRSRDKCVGRQLDIVKKIWDSPDCWVVSDDENRKLFDLKAPKSHRTYMSTGYAEQLQAKVIEVLDRIL